MYVSATLSNSHHTPPSPVAPIIFFIFVTLSSIHIRRCHYQFPNKWVIYLETSKTSTHSQNRSRPARWLPGRNRRAWWIDQTWWCFLAKEHGRERVWMPSTFLCAKRNIHAVRHDQYSWWSSTHRHQKKKGTQTWKSREPIEFVANGGSNRAKAYLLQMVCAPSDKEKKKDFLGWMDVDTDMGTTKCWRSDWHCPTKKEKKEKTL